MIVRLCYVSNSSSSSYVIAYDPAFFGDLKSFFATAILGESTAVKDIKEFIEESPRYKDKIDDAELDGKQVIYLRLEWEHDCIVELLKKINEDTGGNKLEVIYED